MIQMLIAYNIKDIVEKIEMFGPKLRAFLDEMKEFDEYGESWKYIKSYNENQ